MDRAFSHLGFAPFSLGRCPRLAWHRVFGPRNHLLSKFPTAPGRDNALWRSESDWNGAKKARRDFTGALLIVATFSSPSDQTAIAVVGAVHSLAPAVPFAQARAQTTLPGVSPPMITREAVERSSSSHGHFSQWRKPPDHRQKLNRSGGGGGNRVIPGAASGAHLLCANDPVIRTVGKFPFTLRVSERIHHPRMTQPLTQAARG